MATLLCIAGAPAAIVVLVHWMFAVPISSFRPVLNDEVAYWHQALTFSRVGFHGGYYTTGELTNASGFTPFGHHGPGFAVVYGSLGALLGWYRHSVLVINFVAISAAATLWVLLARVSTARLWLSGLLLLSFWPLLYWASTGMQEGFHHAGAIAMAAVFAYEVRSDRPSRVPIVVGWVLLAVLSFVRPSWLVLIPIWAICTVRPRGTKRVIVTIAGSAIVGVAILTAFDRSVAPVPAGFFVLLSSGLRALWDNAWLNVVKTAALSEYQPLEVLHRFQYWLFLIATIAVVVVAVWRVRTGKAQTWTAPHLVISSAAMLGALVLMLLLYSLSNFAENRVLSAFLLFGSLLCATAPTRSALWLVSALVASNLATVPMFLASFESARRDNFIWDRRGVYELADALEGKVEYRRDQSRWCNTLLTSQYPPYLIAVPAGIGLSVVREADNLVLPPKSQYLLLDPPAIADLAHPLHLETLATLPYGTLYRNLESNCPQH